MPDMPSWVAKGSILMKLDAASQGTLRDILADLQAPNPDIARIAANRLGISPQAEQHLRDDWFTANPNWWGRDTTDEVANGLKCALGAMNLAGDEEQGKAKSVDCYWMCCCSGGEAPFKFMYRDNGSRMVIVIRTGTPASPPGRPMTDDEVFWTVEGTNPPEHPQYGPI